METGQKVKYVGKPGGTHVEDMPCHLGQCVGTILDPYKVDNKYTQVKWDTTCEWHAPDFASPGDTMVETVKTILIQAI